jgi:hypothetical protein
VALAELLQQQRLALFEGLADQLRQGVQGHRILAARDAARRHHRAVLRIARADLGPDGHALELPVDGAAAEGDVGAVVDVDAATGRPEPVAELAGCGRNCFLALDRDHDGLDLRQPRRDAYAFWVPVSLMLASNSVCIRSHSPYPYGRMTMMPRTGPLSASSALVIKSWYQRGKSCACEVRTGASAMAERYGPRLPECEISP